MPVLASRLNGRRLVAALVLVVLVVVGAGSPETGRADIAAKRAEAARLRAAVDAESARIAATANGIADAQQRVAALDARARRRQEQAADAQDRLVIARASLTRLERRAERAVGALRANLVATYKADTPDVVTVVLNARGFGDLIDKLAFYKRIAGNNARILETTREAKRLVAAQARQLEGMRRRFSALARRAVADRDRADVIRNALLRRQAEQLRRRDGASARLQLVRADIDRIERRRALAAAAARQAATAAAEAPSSSAPSGSSGSSGSAPSAAGGDVVARVVAAATQIATTPYVWGGGHGSFDASGYDCSGSISYALAAGGLLSSPLDSTGFMSWGEAGPGRRITVYANAGHAFMIVDGRRYDTSALSGGGTRWTSEGRSTAGFVARHPPGL